MKILPSEIVSAYGEGTIGSKILDIVAFDIFLRGAVSFEDWTRGSPVRMLTLPSEAFATVSAGDGPRSDDPLDYVIRSHRGRVSAFLRREKAGEVEELKCLVFTREAYCSDPEVGESEKKRVEAATHVLVAIHACAAPSAPLSPYRLVSNLSGSSNQWIFRDGDLTQAMEFIERVEQAAVTSISHDSEWSVVADR